MKESSQNQSSDVKRKIMLITTILLFIVLAYLVYNMFFTDSAKVPRAANPIAAATTPSTPGSAAQMTAPSIVESGGVKTIEMHAPTEEEKEILKHSREIEQQYLQLVGQYQLAQLQQKLEQTNAQIAQSKLSALKAESEAKKYDVEASGSSAAVENLRALYVGYRQGAWIAMLSTGSTMFQVHTGTHLPDGSIVSSISNNGVILNKNGQRVYLAIPTSLEKTSKTANSNAASSSGSTN